MRSFPFPSRHLRAVFAAAAVVASLLSFAVAVALPASFERVLPDAGTAAAVPAHATHG